MRLIVALAVFVLTFVLVSAQARQHNSVPLDAPVVVYSAEPVRVVLPISASEERVVEGLQESLEVRASATANPIVSQELLDLRSNTERLEWLASTGVQKFDSGQAAALAYSLYSVDVDSAAITIVSVTAELIPGYRGIATSRDHEDGHAYVNEELARLCGPAIARRLVAEGLGARRLEHTILVELHAIGDVAHEIYHGLVENARLGWHRRHAQTATEQTVAREC